MHAPIELAALLAVSTGPVPQGVVLAAGSLLGGYIVGCVPIAWLLVRRAERRRLHGGVERIDPTPLGNATALLRGRASGARRPGTMEAFAAGGIRVALLTVALELIKGAVVGLGARAYNDSSWFAAFAIAGCVVGDAFPLGVRRGGRGIAPLVSGMWAALPGAWSAGVVVAIPALVIVAIGGVAYDAVLAVCVPLAFVLGTHDPVTLVPAAIVVVALITRSRIRRAQRAGLVDAWRSVRHGPAPEVRLEPPLPGAQPPR